MDDNILKKIGDAVVNYAPALAGVLAASGVGAPAAGAVMALASLGKSFGLGSAASPEQVLQVVTTDPEVALKSMIAEQDFTLKMRNIDLDEMRAGLADVQNARQREIEITKASGKRDQLQMLLAMSGVFCPVFIVMYLIVIGLPKLDQSTALMIGGFLGVIIGEYKTIFGYFFGSSQSSKDKDATMANTAATLAEKK